MTGVEGANVAPVRTHDLTKEYDGRVTVNRVNLTVRPGEIYGFLGPNGAGKTTTIRMLLGLLRPTAGRVELFGQDLDQAGPELRERIGVMGEHAYLYDDMTALEYLDFFARFYRVPERASRCRELLERLDLGPFADLRARDFSQGMQRKLSLARAVLHDPALLILDEPVSGLDPYGIVQVRELLDERRAAGCAVFVSSHILSEVERTADRVGVIHRGRLLLEDSVDRVVGKLTTGLEVALELETAVPGLTLDLGQLPGVRITRDEGRVIVLHLDAEPTRSTVSQCVTRAGGVVVGMTVRRATLEEAFIQLTEGKLEQAGLVGGQDAKARASHEQ